MKVPLQTVASMATDAGYKGKGGRDDFKAMTKYLADTGAKAQFEGKDIGWDTIELDEPSAKVYTFAKPEPERKPEEPKSAPPEDLDLKVRALLNQELKARGVETADVKNRPGNPSAELKVGKSPEQKWYDNRIEQRVAVFTDYVEAKTFAHYVAAQAALTESRPGDYERHMKEYLRLAQLKDYATTPTSAGGALVPDQFDNRVIRLVKSYGVARSICTVVRMTGTDVVRPRVATAGLTVYYPDEGGSVTASQETWGNVRLRAKKGVVTVKMSEEIIADAAIDIVEDAAREAARALAKVEDESLFNGTGAGPGGAYIPNVTGILNTFGSTATEDSRSTIGGDTSGAHTAAHLYQCMALAANFEGEKLAWHCSPQMAAVVLVRLSTAVGGATVQDFAGLNMKNIQAVGGFPIVKNNVMNTDFDTGADTVDILFGDVSQAAYFGDRQGMEIATSRERYFDTMQLALRVSVRHDIYVHDLGSTSTASPVVALFQT